MGLFDFLKGGGVNKNIQRIEERKKRFEEHRINIAQNKIEREKRQQVEDLKEKKKNDYLTSLNLKIMCEDGVERNYYGKNLGIIVEPQKENGEPQKFKRIKNLENNKYIPYYFKSYEIGESENARNDFVLINEKWFSKEGKYLTQEQILTRNEIEQVEHNYHIENNLDYKKYIEWESRPRHRMKFHHNTGGAYRYIFKINNIFLVYQGNVESYVRCPNKLFTGIIDGVKYINGKEII
jgi:hypothetical protein